MFSIIIEHEDLLCFNAYAIAAKAPMTTYERIYSTVRRIPEGRVATYGQIAALAGIPRHARQVGYALAALKAEDDVPWHRVVNAKGEISLRSEPGYDHLQRVLLQDEGVVFDAHGRIALRSYQWRPTRL